MKKLTFVRPTGLREPIFTTFMLEMVNPIAQGEEVEMVDMEGKSYGVAEIQNVQEIQLWSIPALFLEECQDRRCITMSGLAQTLAAHCTPDDPVTITTKVLCIRLRYLRDSIIKIAGSDGKVIAG